MNNARRRESEYRTIDIDRVLSGRARIGPVRPCQGPCPPCQRHLNFIFLFSPCCAKGARAVAACRGIGGHLRGPLTLPQPAAACRCSDAGTVTPPPRLYLPTHSVRLIKERVSRRVPRIERFGHAEERDFDFSVLQRASAPRRDEARQDKAGGSGGSRGMWRFARRRRSHRGSASRVRGTLLLP